MRLKWVPVLILAALCGSCASRIQKQTVPSQDASQAYLHMQKGDRLLREGKDHLALLSYLEASTLNPYHEVIFNKLAIVYSRLSMLRQGRKAIRRSLRLNPQYAFGYNTRGIIELAERQPSRAVRSFQKAIRLRPEKSAFYINLGNAYLAAGKYPLGRDAFLKAISLNPDAFQFDDAIQVSAMNDVPDPEKYYQMAKIFADLGDKDSCLLYLGKALYHGFKDGQRLQSETVFEQFRADQDFTRLVQSYGLQI